jgi:hypothetical protein
MLGRMMLATVLTVLLTSMSKAQVFDYGRYPDLKGQWLRLFLPGVRVQSLDPTKSGGYAQGAPLTAEYNAVFEQSLADQAEGKQGHFTGGVGCQPFSMPMMMTAFNPHEYIITPDVTYILINREDSARRIFTDGRDWPADLAPTYSGYSIGKWVDEDGDGKYDVLEVETRGPFKGRRSYDTTGLPLHHDNDSIFKERFFLDKSNPNVLHNVITVLDRALTRPWTVDKRYDRVAGIREIWEERYCTENNQHVLIGEEDYFVRSDGILMPTRRDQPAPDLRYFKQSPAR